MEAAWDLILNLAKSVGVPILSAIVGFVVGRKRSRGDYVEKRLDDLCSCIVKTADLASEYWKSVQTAESLLLEAKINAGLTQIAGFRVLLEDEMSSLSITDMRAAEAAFFRNCTGGDFGVHNRTTELQRAVAAQLLAAELLVVLRRSRLADLRGWRQRA